MDREEALAKLEKAREFFFSWHPDRQERKGALDAFDAAIAVLSSPCACGGEEPAGEFAAWMDADIHASLSALAAPFRLPRTGMVHLYGEDSRIGNHRKPLRILFFDDLPEDKPCS